MNLDDSHPENWPPCPDGALQQFGRDLKSRRRREQFRRAAAQASVVMIAVSAAWFLTQPATGPQERNFGGVTCAAVHQALPDYLQGRVDSATAEKIKLHLAACPSCQELVRQAGADPIPQAALRRPPTACPHCGPSQSAFSLARLETSAAAWITR